MLLTRKNYHALISSIMPKPPERFPSIDLSAAGVVIPEGSAPEVLAAGFNSSAWRIGGEVVKVTSQPQGPEEAIKLLDTMKDEHEVLARFIGEYMTETRYAMGWETGANQARVVAIQPFVEGASLPDFLGDPDNPTDQLQEFLAKSKEVFKAERLMPDIACIENGFNVFRNSNILIREGEEAKPELVDTTFGKTQRHKAAGPLWTRFIYSGAVIAHARLNRRERQ